MWKKKKNEFEAVLQCPDREHLRLAIEVLTGVTVRIKHLNFNSRRGQIFVGTETCDISFFFHGNDAMEFTLTGDIRTDERYLARFFKKPTNGERRGVWVCSLTHELKESEKNWVIGTSATDREFKKSATPNFSR